MQTSGAQFWQRRWGDRDTLTQLALDAVGQQTHRKNVYCFYLVAGWQEALQDTTNTIQKLVLQLLIDRGMVNTTQLQKTEELVRFTLNYVEDFLLFFDT